MYPAFLVSLLGAFGADLALACADEFKPISGSVTHNPKTETLRNDCSARDSQSLVRHPEIFQSGPAQAGQPKVLQKINLCHGGATGRPLPINVPLGRSMFTAQRKSLISAQRRHSQAVLADQDRQVVHGLVQATGGLAHGSGGVLRLDTQGCHQIVLGAGCGHGGGSD